MPEGGDTWRVVAGRNDAVQQVVSWRLRPRLLRAQALPFRVDTWRKGFGPSCVLQLGTCGHALALSLIGLGLGAQTSFTWRAVAELRLMAKTGGPKQFCKQKGHFDPHNLACRSVWPGSHDTCINPVARPAIGFHYDKQKAPHIPIDVVLHLSHHKRHLLSTGCSRPTKAISMKFNLISPCASLGVLLSCC